MQHSATTVVSRCRSCDAEALLPFLDLGETPVANALLSRPDQDAPAHPLHVGVCQACWLVQLLHVLPAQALFDADYPYFSSYSDLLLQHSAEHVAALRAAGRTGPGRYVVEVASNDGYLLRNLLEDGTRVLGVEPSPGPAAAARAAGVPTVEVFLDRDSAAVLRREHGPADVVLANNVLAHVPDLRGFVAGIAELLADDGVLEVENPGVDALLARGAYDTVYHEHYCYLSTTSVEVLLASEGLHLNHVTAFPDLHGGTLRWTASRRPGRSAALEAALEDERRAGLRDPATYLAFRRRVAQLQDGLRELLAQLLADGAVVAAYGAAAKGATLLNTCGIDARTVSFVVDRNPAKQGRFMPGSRVPVLPPEALLERSPSHLLVLAWNVLPEVRRQQAEFERRGGRLVVPVPRPQVLEPLAAGGGA